MIMRNHRTSNGRFYPMDFIYSFQDDYKYDVTSAVQFDNLRTCVIDLTDYCAKRGIPYHLLHELLADKVGHDALSIPNPTLERLTVTSLLERAIISMSSAEINTGKIVSTNVVRRSSKSFFPTQYTTSRIVSDFRICAQFPSRKALNLVVLAARYR